MGVLASPLTYRPDPIPFHPNHQQTCVRPQARQKSKNLTMWFRLVSVGKSVAPARPGTVQSSDKTSTWCRTVRSSSRVTEIENVPDILPSRDHKAVELLDPIQG